jgi:hypothetical protein
MKKLLLLFIFLAFVSVAQAQPSTNLVRRGLDANKGATCTAGSIWTSTDTGHAFFCPAGTWVDFGTGGSSGANTALSNLASVSINTSLLAQAGVDSGSTVKPFRDYYLFGSGTYATTYIKLTGTPTGTRTATFPDSNTTIPIASQVITFAGPTAARTYTFPDAAATIARTDAGQTFTGTQAFGATTNSGTITQTSASATAFSSGPNGATNPVFQLVNSTASQADGLSITGLAAGSGVNLTALSSGSNAPINLVPKGTGQVVVPVGADSDTPGLAFPGISLTGIGGASNVLRFMANGERWSVNGTALQTYSTGMLAWTSNAVEGTRDVGLGRNAAGVLEVNTGTLGGLGKLLTGVVVTAKTTNYSVVTADKGTYFTNVGAGGEVDFTLPTAVAGMRYTFIVEAAQVLKVIAGASTTIRIAGSVSAAAGNITNSTIGGVVTLIATSSTTWIAIYISGSWVVT